MPNFPIIDAHVHLWDPERVPISWVAGNTTLDQRYGLAEFHNHTRDVDVAAFVYVEVGADEAFKLVEATWVAEQAKLEPRLRGMVASAPIEYGAGVRLFLEQLRGIGPMMKGVRRILQSEADPAFCLRPRFVEGVRLLAHYDFSFDICVYHNQLASVVELVRACPETQFMLDHIGKPNIREGQIEPWQTHIAALAELPNVYCKVSGMVTEANHTNWQPEQLAPYVAHVLACFGEDRVAFGGDWPVVLLAAQYQRWVATLDALTKELSEAGQRKLWADNARRFYRLDA